MSKFSLLLMLVSATALADPCQYSRLVKIESPDHLEWTLGNVAKECELIPGIIAAPMASVEWYPSGSICYLFSTGKDSVVGGYRLGAGAFLVWHENGALESASGFLFNTSVGPGVVVSGKSASGFSYTVNWYEDGKVRWVQALGADLLDHAGKVIAQRCRSAWFHRDGTLESLGDLYRCD